MTRTTAARLAALTIACTIAGILPPADADPIVFQNLSYIFGVATVLQNGAPVVTGNSFDTSHPLTPQPTSGSWSTSDSRATDALGASASVRSSVAGTISGSRILGSGAVVQSASVAAGTTDVGGQSWGRSITNLSFQIDQPSTFSYTGRYAVNSDTVAGVMAARLSPLTSAFGNELPPLFTDDFRFFVGSLDTTSAHGGVLQPGFYSLIVADDPLFVTAPSASFKNSAYDYALELTPTPEPAGVLLLFVGVGALCLLLKYWLVRDGLTQL